MKSCLSIRTLVAGLGVSFCFAGSSFALSLSDAVRSLLQNNPQLAASEASLRASDEDVAQGVSGFLPQIDLTGRLGTSKMTGASSAASLQDYRTGKGYSVTLMQQIFDGSILSSTVERLQAIRSGASYEGAVLRITLARKVAELYFEVLKNRRLLDLTKQNMDALTDIRDRIKPAVDAGALSIGDLLHVSSRLDASKNLYESRVTALRTSMESFYRFTGVKAEGLEDETNPVVLVSGLLSDVKKLSDSGFDSIVMRHPAYLQAKSKVDAQDFAVKVVRGSYLPNVNAELSYTYKDKYDGLVSDTKTTSAMLVGRWNLYRGGGDQARERAALARRDAERQALRDITLALSEEVSAAMEETDGARRRLGVIASQVKNQEQVRNVYVEQLKLGKRSVLNVLDAENEYFSAQSNFVVTRYQMIQNAYRLSAVFGDIYQRIGVNDVVMSPDSEATTVAKTQ